MSLSSSAVSDDEVLISQVGDKGVFTMNRPKVLNALNINMIRTMTTQLKVNCICSIKPVFVCMSAVDNFLCEENLTLLF